MEAVNQRERVSVKGWRSKNPKLIALADLREWRSIRFEGLDRVPVS
jgi:hypothetical protein